MDFTRKNYLELFKDGQPVIASGRTSNRHTTIVEAGEHAEQHAREIGVAGSYEVRVDGGLYYMVKITDLVLDAELDPDEPPAAQAQVYINGNSYSGDENTVIEFLLVRNIRTDQVVDVDWAVVNASVTPASGTARFQLGESAVPVSVLAQSVDTTEQGTLELSNPVLVSGPSGAPILADPNVVPFTVLDTDVFNSTPTNATYGSGVDLTNNTGYVAGENLVNGWNWAVHPDHVGVPRAGIFQNTSAEGVAAYNDGPRLKKVDIQWDQIETSEGNYNFGQVNDAINGLGPEFDGIMMNVRGNVVKAVDAGGNPTKPEQITAPVWLSSKVGAAGQVQENLHGSGVQFTNLRLANSVVKNAWWKLIDEFGSRNILANPKIASLVIHGVSHSQGEEWTGTQAGTPEAVAAMLTIINRWTGIDPSNAHKLMWLRPEPQELFDAAVLTGGTGVRGGSIEKYLEFIYNPGRQYQSGIAVEATQVSNWTVAGEEVKGYHYQKQDPNFNIVANDRSWMEENEVYNGDPWDRWGYRAGHLKGIQMRLNQMWIKNDGDLDPRIDHWLAYQLGQQPGNQSAEAFCWLMETYVKGGSGNLPVSGNWQLRNMEHWLYQREQYGSTTPTQRYVHGRNFADAVPSALWYTDAARRGTKIGFGVDPLFITGAQPIELYITFEDNNTSNFTLTYNNGGGAESGSRVVPKQNSGNVRTAKIVLNDFSAVQTGNNPDFYLSGGNTDFYCARIVKL
jgi:hypothetical protein